VSRAETEDLAKTVLDAALKAGWRIATAESCTGGMIAAALTDLPGASSVFDLGFVTYANRTKRAALGVSAAALNEHGAVSEPVAREMAEGARKAAGADIAVSVSGIAGPGGSDHKPEGMVCFAVATATQTHAETVLFGAIGRAEVRLSATRHALRMIAGFLPAPEGGNAPP
jgi:nicotinamide-nucleotide amidase